MGAIVATLSGPTANSYLTLAEANAYFATRLHAQAWENASDADREAALITACRAIESCRLRCTRDLIGGQLSPVTQEQALTFPRYRDVDASLAYIIPGRVKQAQCEEALALLAYGATAQQRQALQAGGVSSYTVDGLSETYREGAGQHPLLSARARTLIMPYIDRTGVIATSPHAQGELSPGSR